MLCQGTGIFLFLSPRRARAFFPRIYGARFFVATQARRGLSGCVVVLSFLVVFVYVRRTLGAIKRNLF